MALAINVKVTLDDPFTMVNEEALAQETTQQNCKKGEGGGDTLCNNLKPVISNVYEHSITGSIQVVNVGVNPGILWDNIGYDMVCNVATVFEWCDIAKQGRTLYEIP